MVQNVAKQAMQNNTLWGFGLINRNNKCILMGGCVDAGYATDSIILMDFGLSIFCSMKQVLCVCLFYDYNIINININN